MEQVIGIDLGGTAIKLGRFDRAGNCLQSISVPTPQPAEPQAVLNQMVAAIAQVDPDHQAIALGVGTPGPADAAGRIARVAINLGWKDVPLADWLEAKTGKPTILANDANCAGLGESWLGAGRQFRDMILLTLGTGVGGAVVMDGQLFVGRHGTAGELGLITLNPEGAACNSGNQGSLEQHVSVQAIRRRTGLEPAELGRRAEAGDAEAIAFWETYGRELAAGLASLIYVLTPEAVIIGGGVSASFHLFYPALLAELEKRVLLSSREGLQILPAELGNQAGIAGAAKLAWQRLAELETTSSSVPPDDSQTDLQNLQTAYQLASEMSKFKAGFLARTSHELRSPLNGVIGMHQLILADLSDSPEEEREFVAQAHTAAMKMLAMLDEVIAISKAEHGTARLNIQPLSLTEVLDAVYQQTHLQAKNRNLRLEVERPHPDLQILADLKWLRQVLVYLLDTPISLMQDGTISLTVHPLPDSHRVAIQIEDQRPASSWQESLDAFNWADTPSPLLIQNRTEIAPLVNSFPSGLTLMAVQSLLHLMQGRLELLAVPDENGKLTRLQCLIPLA